MTKGRTQPKHKCYLPVSSDVSQFSPPMLVSQERRMRPALDTVIASAQETNTTLTSTTAPQSEELWQASQIPTHG